MSDTHLTPKTMRVLITGGAGFIGSAVAKYLAEKGFEIRTLDIVKPKKPVGEHILGSIMFPDEIAQVMKGCEAVVHLAAMLGVKRTEAKRMECLEINIKGTKNILEECCKRGIKKIIFSSSSEVYGEPQRLPIRETDPVSPKSVYGISKLAGEEYLKAYQKEWGLDYSILRFFNIYGPGQIAEFVIPRFVKAVREDQPPTIYGDGSQIRSFCYVGDAAQAVWLALTNQKANGQTFNIGNDKTETTIKELASRVIKLSGKDLQPTFLTMEMSDRTKQREIVKRTPDISKARKFLGYEPQVDLNAGIMKMMQGPAIPAAWF